MKQIKWLVTCFGSLALLSGCSHNPAADSVNTQNPAIENSLNAAAQSASASLAQLSAIEQAQHPLMDALPFPEVKDTQLDQLIFVRWYGPLEPLLSMVSVKVGYQLQVFGKPPSLPILVNIDDANNLVPAIDILRNASLQTGTRARVQIYTTQKIISLRYL